MAEPDADSIWKVASEPASWADRDADALLGSDWTGIQSLPPFVHSDGSGEATFQTTARLVASPTRISVRFDCDDPDIWATMTERDDPLYEEEVVEMFLAAGDADPTDYFEFEVSPDGALFDATISNPDSDRLTMKGDAAWNCAGIGWAANRSDAENRWSAVMVIPWKGLGCNGAPPHHWRANFFRIERPRKASVGKTEYSCWKPTMVSPADFHKPASFGHLLLPGH